MSNTLISIPFRRIPFHFHFSRQQPSKEASSVSLPPPEQKTEETGEREWWALQPRTALHITRITALSETSTFAYKHVLGKITLGLSVLDEKELQEQNQIKIHRLDNWNQLALPLSQQWSRGSLVVWSDGLLVAIIVSFITSMTWFFWILVLVIFHIIRKCHFLALTYCRLILILLIFSMTTKFGLAIVLGCN